MNEARPGGYISLQAYLAPEQNVTESLQKVRLGLLKRLKLVTSLGYGPRFLHSTGQLHKGGPYNVLFLQIIDEPKTELHVSETDYTFNSLIHAQSKGDYDALRQRGRRIIRINLRTNVLEGLEKLASMIQDMD